LARSGSLAAAGTGPGQDICAVMSVEETMPT
jgi:hypothetical protein